MKVGITVLIALTAAGLMAADLPHIGRWKLNPSKSDFGETTITYEAMAGGQIKVTVVGHDGSSSNDSTVYERLSGGRGWRASGRPRT